MAAHIGCCTPLNLSSGTCAALPAGTTLSALSSVSLLFWQDNKALRYIHTFNKILTALGGIGLLYVNAKNAFIALKIIRKEPRGEDIKEHIAILKISYWDSAIHLFSNIGIFL